VRVISASRPGTTNIQGTFLMNIDYPRFLVKSGVLVVVPI
jgi:hypothetical protein